MGWFFTRFRELTATLRARTRPRPRLGGWVVAVAAATSALVVVSRSDRPHVPITREAEAAVVQRSTPPVDTLPRTWIEMKNVNLRVASDAVVGIQQLRGEVIPSRRGESAFLDSTRSFSIRITSGTVALASADLGVILNRFVFGYKGSPLKNLRVRTSGSQLVQSGTMHKGVD